VQSKFERDVIIAMLAFGICVPNLFTFFESLIKSVFGNKAWPTFATIFVVSACNVAMQSVTRGCMQIWRNDVLGLSRHDSV